MAKEVYKIPESLDKSMADMPINLQNKDGIGVKPVPIKIVFMWIISLLIGSMFVSKSFIKDGGTVLVLLFSLIWFLLTYLFLKMDKTGEPQLTLLAPMTAYIPKKMRKVFTRSSNDATNFYSILGIQDIDEKRGIVHFFDGSLGVLYKIVGNGSFLLFDSDRKRILNRNESFYRKMKTGYQISYITTREAQKVYRQIGTLKTRYDNLKVPNEDLKRLMQDQFDTLKHYVGGQYLSIQQYAFLRAEDEELLVQGMNWINGEVESSDMMLKKCSRLKGEEVYDILGMIYKGGV